MHATGEGVRADCDLAAHWFRKAGAQGHAHARRCLAVLILHGKVPAGPEAAASAYAGYLSTVPPCAQPLPSSAPSSIAVPFEEQAKSALAELAGSAEVARAVCLGCGALASERKLITCSGCMTARFCGTDCQRRAWKPWHKQHCARFRP